jgi:hypothetical protein
MLAYSCSRERALGSRITHRCGCVTPRGHGPDHLEERDFYGIASFFLPDVRDVAGIVRRP